MSPASSASSALDVDCLHMLQGPALSSGSEDSCHTPAAALFHDTYSPGAHGMSIGDIVSAHLDLSVVAPMSLPAVHDSHPCHISQLPAALQFPQQQQQHQPASHVMSGMRYQDRSQFLPLQASDMMHQVASMPHQVPAMAASVSVSATASTPGGPVTMHPNLVSTLKSILSPLSQERMLPQAVDHCLQGDQMMVDASSGSAHQIGAGSVAAAQPGMDLMLQPELSSKGLQYLLNLDPASSQGPAHVVPDSAAVCAELEYMARANQFLRHQNACCQADMMMMHKQICREQQQQQQLLASYQEMQEMQHNNAMVEHLHTTFAPASVVDMQQAATEMDVLAGCNMMQEAMNFNDIISEQQQQQHSQQSCSQADSQELQYVNLCLSDSNFQDKVDSKPLTFCTGSELDLLVSGELTAAPAVNMVVPEADAPGQGQAVFAYDIDGIAEHQALSQHADMARSSSEEFSAGKASPPHQQALQHEAPALQSMLSTSSTSSGGEYSSHDQEQAAVIPLDLIQNRRPFRCTHAGCNKTFKNPQTMRMHRKTHATAGSGAGAQTQQQQLQQPLSAICKAGQNKKIPCRCPVCKRTFVGLYELRRHFGRKHTQGEKRHACRKCSKRFYIEVDLRDHEKICGEPMECKCGMKFAFKCNLVAHKKAHPECQDHIYSSSEEEKSSGSKRCSPPLLQSPFSKLRPDASRHGRHASLASRYMVAAGMEQQQPVPFTAAQQHMAAFLNVPSPASSAIGSSRMAVKEEVVTAMPLSYYAADVTCTGFQLPPGMQALPHSSVA